MVVNPVTIHPDETWPTRCADGRNKIRIRWSSAAHHPMPAGSRHLTNRDVRFAGDAPPSR